MNGNTVKRVGLGLRCTRSKGKWGKNKGGRKKPMKCWDKEIRETEGGPKKARRKDHKLVIVVESVGSCALPPPPHASLALKWVMEGHLLIL